MKDVGVTRSVCHVDTLTGRCLTHFNAVCTAVVKTVHH